MRREASFQTKFNEYLREQYDGNAAFELKQTGGKPSLSFVKVKEHQINALKAVKNRRLAYKLPDDTRSYRPFDCFILRKAGAFVVIKYKVRWYAIDIDVFINEKETSIIRSLTEERAKEIAAFSG